MHNPPSVSEFILNTYPPAQLEELRSAGIQPSGAFYVDTDMAERLEKILGKSAQMWLNMQQAHDRFISQVARDNPDLPTEMIRELAAAGEVTHYTRRKPTGNN